MSEYLQNIINIYCAFVVINNKLGIYIFPSDLVALALYHSPPKCRYVFIKIQGVILILICSAHFTNPLFALLHTSLNMVFVSWA